MEVFIKAPENSPYKNGVFNFIIKFHSSFPELKPDVQLKTKIVHTEVDHNGRCYIKFYTIGIKKMLDFLLY